MELANIVTWMLLFFGLFIVPLYSAYIVEWRIKKTVKKYEIEDLIKVIREIAEGLK